MDLLSYKTRLNSKVCSKSLNKVKDCCYKSCWMELTEFTNEALRDIRVRPVERSEEVRFQEQMACHHYLGALAKIGETVWYVAIWREQWVALLSLSAAALKCGVRDRWIGWDFRSQYGRLNLIANNSRFLILPGWHRPNIGSRVLSLTERRVTGDWQTRFGHPLLLLETFVDPQRFHGGVWRWCVLGGQLDGTGTDAMVPAHQGRLQRASRCPRAGLCASLAARCARATDPRRSRSSATDRSP